MKAVCTMAVSTHFHAQFICKTFLQHDQCESIHKGCLAGVVRTEQNFAVQFSVTDKVLNVLQAGRIIRCRIFLPIPHQNDRSAAGWIAFQLIHNE